MKRAYPVIFTQTSEVVLAEVPDLEILTQGENIENAIEMARDAIGVTGISMEDHGEDIPEASQFSDIDYSKGTFVNEGTSFVSMVDIDFTEYRRKSDNRTVRRNVTLPNWLNLEAEKAGVNVSKVLQVALMERLGVQR